MSSSPTVSVYSAVPTPARINTIVNTCPASVERLDLPEADRRDRRDRLVQGVQHAEAEHDVADGADHDDAGQREEADHDVAHPPHRATVLGECEIAWRAVRRRPAPPGSTR